MRTELIPVRGERPLPAAAPDWDARPWTAHPAEPDPADAVVPLSQYLWILRRHRWRIAAFVAACSIGVAVVSLRLTPVYESTATIDIDRRMPAGIIGQEASQFPAQDADQFLATQVRLIQSDSVLRPVVRRFKLDEPAGPDAAHLTAEAVDAPVRLKHLRVTRPPTTYLLLISYRSSNRRLAAEAANAIAQSYIEHTYNIRYRATAGLSAFMEKQLEELRAKMERSNAALAQFERELSVINPEEKTNILSARLLQLNTEYTQAQAERVAKEAVYQSVSEGALEAAQVASQGEPLKRAAERVAEAAERFAVVKAQYGANHPEYRKMAAQVGQLEQEFLRLRQSVARRVEADYRQALSREAMLKAEVARTKTEADRLHSRSFQYQSLKREADADKRLYEELITKIKQAGINAGFQNSAIRLADPARPALLPVFPNVRLNVALAFLFSLILAVGTAVLADLVDTTVRDPEYVRRALKTEVLGSLPVVRSWRRRLSVPVRPVSVVPDMAMVVRRPDRDDRGVTSFEEAVRTLRNSILLGHFGEPLKTLLVTSASPAEGKTTTALHLALAHAEQKHRTLLVEADLRRPGIARKLGAAPAAGLVSALLEGSGWRDKILKVDGVPALDILAAGPPDRHSVALLGAALPGLLADAEKDYDLVIVDAPPLLGFSEPLEMAALVDGVVVVSIAGKTNRKAVATVLATLRRVRATVVGVVLNEVTQSLSDSYEYYGYHRKYYRYRDGAEEPA